ncbi:MAG: ABC transporter ATP-binding protein [Gemmatimonadota bacterium]
MAEPGPAGAPLVEVRGLRKHFPVRRGLWGRTSGWVRAVDGVSLAVRRGETLALVGESGSGKTTLGRLILGLLDASAGEVYFNGFRLQDLDPGQMRALRRRMQLVFQDPYSSLNPRWRAGAIVAEGLRIHRLARGGQLEARVAQLLEMVGLPASAARRYPHEFSGGQRQRLGIARALAVEPEFIVADEPVSALDVSVQAQIINLLRQVQRELGLTYLFISHDLGVVRHVADRVAVMYLGRVVEVAGSEALYASPSHPYTRARLAAVPVADPGLRRERAPLQGDVPSPAAAPSGCPFHPRCPERREGCARVVPDLVDIGGRQVACLLRYPEPRPGDGGISGAVGGSDRSPELCQ